MLFSKQNESVEQAKSVFDEPTSVAISLAY
jgi:hypothetical protein